MMRPAGGVIFPGFVAAASPILAFPDPFPAWFVWATVSGVVLVVLCEGWLVGRAATRTPIDLTLIGFCIMAAIGVAVSPAMDVTLPKATGLVLGVATLRVTVFLVRSRQDVWRAAWLYVAMALGIVLLGFIATAWSAKAGVLDMLTSRRPGGIVVALSGRGVNPNALAAATLCVFPLLTGLCLDGSCSPSLRRMSRVAWMLTFAILAMTQSRTAWASAGAALGLILAMRRKWSALAVCCVLLATLSTVAVWRARSAPAPGATNASINAAPEQEGALGPSATLSLEARREVWVRALWAIQDFPVTGLGLGAFRRVVQVLYPFYDQPGDVEAVHAHNQWLQVALDTGLPGLVSYVALLIGCAALCWRVHASDDTRMKMLAIGLGANLLAFQVFGLTDAIAPGAKIGVFSWLTMGLIVAAHRALDET